MLVTRSPPKEEGGRQDEEKGAKLYTFQEAEESEVDREKSRETGEDSNEGRESEQFATPGKEGIGEIAAVRGSGTGVGDRRIYKG